MKYLLFLALVCALPLVAAPAEDPAHQELRAVRDGLLAAMNKGSIEEQLGYLHSNVVITWHNAEVSRHREGVRAYLDRMLNGPTKVVEKFSAEVKVDELSILYGGTTAIAFGSAQEHFEMAGGRTFNLTGRWSATVVKEEGKWLVASLHASDNIFDNPVLGRLKAAVPWVGGGSLALGMVFGWFVSKRFRSA